MVPIHPGRILKRELAARELSANRFALAIRVPSGRVTDILNFKRGVTPDTALRCARFFGNSRGLLDEPANPVRSWDGQEKARPADRTRSTTRELTNRGMGTVSGPTGVSPI